MNHTYRVGFPKYQSTKSPTYQRVRYQTQSKVPNTIMRPYIFVTRFLDGPRFEAYHLDTPQDKQQPLCYSQAKQCSQRRGQGARNRTGAIGCVIERDGYSSLFNQNFVSCFNNTFFFDSLKPIRPLTDSFKKHVCNLYIDRLYSIFAGKFFFLALTADREVER